MSDLLTQHRKPLSNLLLSVADDKLFLGHRNSEWTGLGPLLEEDIAFSALAQDDIAHASELYGFVAELMGGDADRIAFGRSPEEYYCAHIVETPDEFDWATALARQCFCNHFDDLRLERLANSSHAPLAALCARLRAEQRTHVQHVSDWLPRLGGGTMESRERMQKGLDGLASLAPMLFEPVEGQEALGESGLYPGNDAAMFESWRGTVQTLVKRSGLAITLDDFDSNKHGGRQGVRSEHFHELHEEMSEVFQIEPTAAW